MEIDKDDVSNSPQYPGAYEALFICSFDYLIKNSDERI